MSLNNTKLELLIIAVLLFLLQESVRNEGMVALNKVCGVQNKDDLYRLLEELELMAADTDVTVSGVHVTESHPGQVLLRTVNLLRDITLLLVSYSTCMSYLRLG